MKFLFRTDSSLAIGSGHVMRCYSLANALVEKNHDVKFICKNLPGNLISFLENSDFPVIRLPDGISEGEDVHFSSEIVNLEQPDWLVVDHYKINYEWEQVCKQAGNANLMIIDDLADRKHVADLLLDQNYIANYQHRYDGLVPDKCTKLLGPQYALLRPDFLKLRQASLEKRSRFEMKHILVCMGGGDVFKETKRVIEALIDSKFIWKTVNVVVGKSCPHQDTLKSLLPESLNAKLHVQTNQVASLMKRADIAIMGGGSVSWEKCALGLPSLVTAMSFDQKPIAKALHKAGAHIYLGESEHVSIEDYKTALEAIDSEKLPGISQSARQLCDALGVERVIKILEEL